MQLPRLNALLLWAVPAMFVASTNVQADTPGQGAYNVPSADLYISPQPIGIQAIPSGNINVVPGRFGLSGATAEALGSNVFTSTSAPVGDSNSTLNMQGCGGVGQGEYTSALYNMPESFNKFQADAKSVLARQLVTMNYTMPQTAALFDQLNNYGTERYAAFQRGCNLDSLKADAKAQYINACVTKVKPNRITSLTALQFKGAELESMAYAQAWEVCSNQYVSDTLALTARTETNQAFAKQVRDVENVTAAISPLLCNFRKDSSIDSGCWPTLLVPQVRLCLDDTLQGGCSDSKGYGVAEPQVSMQRLFDMFRLYMDDVVVARRAVPFQGEMSNKNFTSSELRNAATDASLRISAAGLNRTDVSGAASGTLITATGVSPVPEASVFAYQVDYLNCKINDPLNSMKEYANALNRIKSGSMKVETIESGSTDRIIKAMKLEDAKADEKQIRAMGQLALVSLGCQVNGPVPMFDPNIMASLNQCLPEDRHAFYTMASYDASLAATRDVYRYLNLRLKQAYTRLMTESVVPTSATIAGTASTSPTISPELNRRLAGVVKEAMIPYMESQIARLEELNNTRGQYAQRVQQIMTNRGGCVYGTTPAGAGSAGSRP